MSRSVTPPLPARRRVDLVNVIRERGQATVSELAARFDVSLDTIRRDLDALASEGLIGRTHGGAIANSGLAASDRPFSRRAGVAIEAKRRIGRAAADFVTDNATLLLNGGSTTMQVAPHLDRFSDLTVVTNNLQLLALVPERAVRDLYIVGGRYWRTSQVTIGTIGFPGVNGISADVAFIGVGSISLDGVLSTNNVAEGRMMREMIEAAGTVVVVADATKFGRRGFAHITDLAPVAALVTDAEPPAALSASLAEAGVEVVIAE